MKQARIIHFKTIDSTQAQAKREQSSLDIEECTVFIADEQTEGKGTRGRHWISPPNVNIYATYAYLTSKLNDRHLINIPQVAAFSVVEVLREFNLEPTYKWVNDILLFGDKICGVLAESGECMKEGVRYRAIFIGIGLNVNMTQDFLIEASLDSITSMRIASGKIFEKSAVFQRLNEALLINLKLLYTYGFTYFFDKINTVLEKFNGDLQWFDVQDGENKSHTLVKASIAGITQHGYLRLIIDGQEKEFFSGRLLKDSEVLALNRH